MSYRETIAEQDFWVLLLCPAAGSQNNFEKVPDSQIKKIPKNARELYLCMYTYKKWPQKSASGFCR